MRHRARPILAPFALLSVLGACASSAPPGDASQDLPKQVQFEPASATAKSWLGEAEQSMVVVGYSTSYAWPTILQQMLDEHVGGERRYHVLNAVIGGSPVEIWRAPQGTESYARTTGPMHRDFFGDEPRLRGAAPAPTLAILQQSLQFTGEDVVGDRRGPVRSEDDTAGAELGADALAMVVSNLRPFGVEDVIIAMHIYKVTTEPEVGNERIALAVLLARGADYIHAGPDLWTVTRDAHPDAFEEDGVHPNQYGIKLMAEGWYRTLAGADVKEDVVERMRARDYNYKKMTQVYLRWRKGEGDAPVPIVR